MFIVGVRRARIAATILLACLALNLIAPVVISAQRALPHEGFFASTYDGPVPYAQELTLTRGAKKDEVDINARLLIDGTEHRDSYTANVATTFPVRDRGGLTYFFPYQPERRSYPYSDPFALEAVPADYLGPGNVAGLETYKYRAEISDGGYHAERIFDLERRTGRVLDETWTTSGGPADGFFRLSEDSRAEAVGAARREVGVLRALQVLAWVTRLAAVLTLAWLAVAFARR
ncbi:porin PorA family protein [Corynebacterium sp. UBA2622]|uniref:porin PorA family protein n=1 Tax=Corynebacterium sp. UBA2622 TaxID=1946393 RepID=UPI0025BD6C5E|nr:porin PorA family protein [Corynebacterium sp. UBA2622]